MRRAAIWKMLAILTAAALASPAMAGWREDIGTFRVGIVAEPGAGNAIPGLAELNEAFGKVLDMNVEFFVARNYPALIDAQVSGRIDYAVYTASAFAAAYLRCECIEPLVAPTGEDGSTGIRSVLVALDGKIGSTDDLAGRKIALLPPDSVAGHQVPLATFRPDGRPLSGSEGFFVQAASAEAAEAMLATGEADAIFGWIPATQPNTAEEAPGGGTIDRLVVAGIDKARLTVVWQSDVLRYGPHAVSIALDAEPKSRLTDFLTKLRLADPEMYERLETRRIGGFTPAMSSDYAVVLKVAKSLAAAPSDAQ
ncbi:MAG: PhnD/SsuA/transferrin family substrate-binding protein [Mesorhizobium sp.]|nr:PhnD/SsuA/transferrin family substrate-binding protein [Mesorhizobium sp.]MBL8578019.1 PhnD/SsuA/transferrin family substrate-binding protein [Mesorhizobium sp.]